MADTTTTEASSPTANDEAIGVSMWGRPLDLTSLRADPKRWNKQWEKVLATLSPQGAYTRMGGLFRKGIWDSPETTLAFVTNRLNAGACKSQDIVVGVWRLKPALKDHLTTAWLLLAPSERERHLLEGFKGASERCFLKQDLRALCPEIRTSLFLARAGRTFIEFVEEYATGKEAMTDSTIPYLLPSAWWDKAGDDMPQSVMDGFDESGLMLLTLLRNEFIAGFLGHSLMSLFGDLMNGSSAMDPIKTLMQEQPAYATALGSVLSTIAEKPLIRCENCTKTPEEIGGDIHFMLCSVCNTKLQFKVHYCSVDCQKKDWPTHKKHCGKQQVSKKLKGTAQDPYWNVPSDMPDHFRIPPTPGLGIPIAETGFGPGSTKSSNSPALKRQIALLRADREADYFLFDAHDRPVRFLAPDQMTKMIFRMNRSNAFSREMYGVEIMSEYLVQVMGQHPGLNRRRIFAQLQCEYEMNVEAKVAILTAATADTPDRTVLERMLNKTTGAMKLGPVQGALYGN